MAIQLTIPHLDRAFDRFKVVQIGDLHTGRSMPESRLAKIIQLVNQQQPDAIAITGDIVTKHNHLEAEKLQQQLSQLQPTSATVAVLGNHDHSPSLELLKQTLASSKINNLDSYPKIHLIVIADNYYERDRLSSYKLDKLPGYSEFELVSLIGFLLD